MCYVIFAVNETPSLKLVIDYVKQIAMFLFLAELITTHYTEYCIDTWEKLFPGYAGQN